MENSNKILIADDDHAALASIERLLSTTIKDIEIIKADNSNAALNIILSKKPMIAVCDLHMPGGSGLDILRKVRSDSEVKDTYFILLSSTNEKENKAKAYEFGVDAYLAKPVDSNQFISKIQSALRLNKMQVQIKKENILLTKLAEELEKELQDMIKLAVKFLQARIPASFDMLRRVADASVWIAQTYGDSTTEEIRDIEVSAYLSQAGRIFLPDNLLKTPVLSNGLPTDPIMYQVPTSGSEIVSSVRRFKNVAENIKHIYENFDGTGIPDRLKSWQIPFPARIIRVALDYEEYRTFQRKKAREALELIKKESQRLYDHRVVILMEQFVKSNEDEIKISNEIALQLIELKPGMITTRDIFTDKGLKLLPQGVSLTEPVIQKIININTTDPILGNVYVKI